MLVGFAGLRISAEAGRHDVGAKQLQLFSNLELCGVLTGADPQSGRKACLNPSADPVRSARTSAHDYSIRSGPGRAFPEIGAWRPGRAGCRCYWSPGRKDALRKEN